MTRKKGFKRLVRERMAKTGERYTAARRQLLVTEVEAPPQQRQRLEIRGVNAAATALRITLEAAGTKLTERTLMLVGGGVGVGVFSFHYPQFSTLFIAGRHLWHDDLAYLEALTGRLGVKLEVRETGGAKRAQNDLFESLETGPVIAFVDLGSLGHRGGVEAYYVVTVLQASESEGSALIADLTDEPVEVPLATLARARARHKKFKNRLVRVASAPATVPRGSAIREGVRACVDGLVESPMPGIGTNFTLDSLALLAKRMRGEGKGSWPQVFPPGPRLWGALASIYEYVEHYGTGGGLLRPFFAEALAGEPSLSASRAADAYAVLGESWSGLAQSALDPEVRPFAELARTIDETYAVYDELGPDSGAELEALRQRRHEILSADFPLSESEAKRLVERLAERVEELEAREREARQLLLELV